MLLNRTTSLHVHMFFNMKIAVFFIIYAIYAFIFKEFLSSGSMTLFEFHAIFLTNPHTLIYLVFPIFSTFLFHALFLNIKNDDLILIRFSKIPYYFLAKVWSLFVISTLFVLCLNLSIISVGLGLPFQNQFLALLQDPSAQVMLATFKTPLMLIVAQSVYLIIGLWFIAVLMYFLGAFFPTFILFLCTGLSFLGSILWASNRFDFTIFKPLLISSYLIPNYEGNFIEKNVLTMTIAAVVVFFLVFVSNYLWRSPFKNIRKV